MIKTRNRSTIPLAVRLSQRLKQLDNGCMVWTGYIYPNGYATIGLGRKGTGNEYIHRVAYELAKGKIPEGLVIDHLCRNRACANPDHLEAVTTKVNLSRGIRATKTECDNGHILSGDNLYRDPRGARQCRKCRRLAIERYRHKLDKQTKW